MNKEKETTQKETLTLKILKIELKYATQEIQILNNYIEKLEEILNTIKN